MSHLPLHSPRTAPAVLATSPAETARAASVLLAVAAVALTGAGVLAVATPGHATDPAPRMAPVAAVFPAPVVGVLADLAVTEPTPPHPGWAPPAFVTSTMLGSSLPQVAAMEDRAGEPPPPEGADALPAVPLPLDPTVVAAIARLRAGAGDLQHGLRPGPAALVAMNRALNQVGDPYVWGATGPDSFDCSGLMWWSYAGADVYLPRVSRDQAAGGGQPVPVDKLLPGDLVFFATAAWDPGVVHHVGMYVGHGLMVDAPRPGLRVRVEPVPAEGYAGAVRPVPAVTGDHEQPRRHPRHPAGPGPRPTLTPAPAPAAGAPAAAAPGPATAPTPTTQPSDATQPSESAEPTPTPTPTDVPTGTPTDSATADPTPDPTLTAVPTVQATLASVLSLVPTTGKGG
jgi:cell wall-associated NlpC family hydrolase